MTKSIVRQNGMADIKIIFTDGFKSKTILKTTETVVNAKHGSIGFIESQVLQSCSELKKKELISSPS